MKVVAYVPLKLNNERLPSKNTKAFRNGQPLLTYILSSLSQCTTINQRFVYCSDNSVEKYLPQNFTYLSRSKNLDRSETKINEIMQAFAQSVDADIYVLAHATAPFVSTSTIDKGIEAVLSGKYDSAFTVQKLQEFMWLDGKPVNYDPKSIPRTQDLPAYYTETTGLYIYTKDLILNENRRIGDNPFLIEVSKIEAVDINEPIDFTIAEAIYHEVFNQVECDRS